MVPHINTNLTLGEVSHSICAWARIYERKYSLLDECRPLVQYSYHCHAIDSSSRAASGRIHAHEKLEKYTSSKSHSSLVLGATALLQGDTERHSKCVKRRPRD